MKTVERVAVTRIVPLQQNQVVMVHVTPDLGRDWRGPVALTCDGRRVAMECVGVGETGAEVAVMLRPLASDRRTVQGIVAALGGGLSCALYLERHAADSAG